MSAFTNMSGKGARLSDSPRRTGARVTKDWVLTFIGRDGRFFPMETVERHFDKLNVSAARLAAFVRELEGVEVGFVVHRDDAGTVLGLSYRRGR